MKVSGSEIINELKLKHKDDLGEGEIDLDLMNKPEVLKIRKEISNNIEELKTDIIGSKFGYKSYAFITVAIIGIFFFIYQIK